MRRVERNRINRERKPDFTKATCIDDYVKEARRSDIGKVACRTGKNEIILVYPDDPRLEKQCKIHP